jgi:MEDS: MEthanogen/methylotroph, DcmR Sensory domain
MHLELDRRWDDARNWDGVVAAAAPCDHIVQLYQDQDFLNRAVCRFAGAALANGEGIILVPTLTHWNAIRPRLEAEGVDVEAARTRGQLTVVDADEFLPPLHAGLHAGFAAVPRPRCGRHRTGARRRAL